jgi:hypothetical protein
MNAREHLGYAVAKTADNRLLSAAYGACYWLAARSFIFALRGERCVEAAYVRNSVSEKRSRPGLSDIDYTVILREGTSPGDAVAFERRLQRRMSGLKRIYPMLGEVEVMRVPEFIALCGLRIPEMNCGRWMRMWGRDVRPEDVKPTGVAVADEVVNQFIQILPRHFGGAESPYGSMKRRRLVDKIVSMCGGKPSSGDNTALMLESMDRLLEETRRKTPSGSEARVVDRSVENPYMSIITEACEKIAARRREISDIVVVPDAGGAVIRAYVVVDGGRISGFHGLREAAGAFKIGTPTVVTEEVLRYILAVYEPILSYTSAHGFSARKSPEEYSGRPGAKLVARGEALAIVRSNYQLTNPKGASVAWRPWLARALTAKRNIESDVAGFGDGGALADLMLVASSGPSCGDCELEGRRIVWDALAEWSRRRI